MKTSRLVILAFLSVSMIFLSSCKEDEEPEVSAFVGEYTLESATISEPLVLTTNEIGDLAIPPGIDITAMMEEALLGAIQCDAATLIELREDFSVYLSCSSSDDELNAGTWEEQSETVLVLSLNSTAVPSSLTGVVLTVTDVTLVGNLLSGSTSIPVAEAMLASIVTAMSQGNATLNTDVTPDAVPMTFSIELQKQ